MRWTRYATTLAMVALVAALAVGLSGASAAPLANGDWNGFGRTSENNRHSPLTEITPANVTRLHRRLQEDRPDREDR
jgi:glucose dehydrogenase